MLGSLGCLNIMRVLMELKQQQTQPWRFSSFVCLHGDVVESCQLRCCCRAFWIYVRISYWCFHLQADSFIHLYGVSKQHTDCMFFPIMHLYSFNMLFLLPPNGSLGPAPLPNPPPPLIGSGSQSATPVGGKIFNIFHLSLIHLVQPLPSCVPPTSSLTSSLVLVHGEKNKHGFPISPHFLHCMEGVLLGSLWMVFFFFLSLQTCE